MIRPIRRLLTFLCGFTFALALMAWIPNEIVVWPNRRTAILASTTLLALVILVRVLASRVRPGPLASVPKSALRRERRRSRRIPDIDPGAESLERRLHFASECVEEWKEFSSNPNATADLASVLVSPSTYIARLTELVDLDDLKLTKSVTRTIRTATAGGGQLPMAYFPALRVRKRELIHRMKIEVDGKRISTLPYRESQGATLAVVELFYDIAIGGQLKWESSLGLWPEIVWLVSSDSPVSSKMVDRVVSKVRLQAVDARPESARGKAADALCGLLSTLASTYLICVNLPETGRPTARLTVEHVKGRTDLCTSGVDRIRLGLGLSVRQYVLDLAHATESDSYHLQGTFDRGLYLYKAFTSQVGGAEDSKGSLAANRIESTTEGLDFYHVYLRDFRRNASPETATTSKFGATAILELRERPPGSLGLVVLLSIFLTGLVFIVAGFYGSIFPSATAPASGTSWPTILFSIPALMSSWIVSRFNAETLSRMSLSSLMATIWVVANAVSVVTFAALRMAVSSDGGVWQIADGIVINHVFWFFAMLSCGTQLGTCTTMLVFRNIRYIRRLSGAEEG